MIVFSIDKVNAVYDPNLWPCGVNVTKYDFKKNIPDMVKKKFNIKIMNDNE